MEQLQANIKHKLVMQEYFANNFNGAKAWQKFYPDASNKAASNLFSKMAKTDEMQEYAARISQSYAIKAGWRQERIVEQLAMIAQDAMEGDPIIWEGRDTGFRKKDRAAAIKAIELIGKHLGMFNETHQHLTINYNDVVVDFLD